MSKRKLTVSFPKLWLWLFIRDFRYHSDEPHGIRRLVEVSSKIV